VCGQTDLGRQRTNNEDNFLVADMAASAIHAQREARTHVLGSRGSLLVVADGMGGANAGEVASQMAVEIIHRQMEQRWPPADGGGATADTGDAAGARALADVPASAGAGAAVGAAAGAAASADAGVAAGADAGAAASADAGAAAGADASAVADDGAGSGASAGALARGPDELLRRLVEAVRCSNREIKARGMEDETKRGMGSTCVVAGVVAGRAYLCNVGDSRGYLLRGTEARQLTHDQSFVQHLLDVGAITPEQAARSPRRNVVMEALGAREDVNVAQVAPLALEHGDILVLCSDGLTGHVEGEDIMKVVYATTDPVDRCQRLIDLANKRGGKDNITVIVGEVEIEGKSPVVRPVLPPPAEVEPEPPPPPDRDGPAEPPAASAPSVTLVHPLPVESDPAAREPDSREYSLAIGFILGLAVGLVAVVLYLGDQQSAQQRTHEEDINRMKLESESRAERLLKEVAGYVQSWDDWYGDARRRADLPPPPALPDGLAGELNRLGVALPQLPPSPPSTPAPSPSSMPRPPTTPATPAPSASPRTGAPSVLPPAPGSPAAPPPRGARRSSLRPPDMMPAAPPSQRPPASPARVPSPAATPSPVRSVR
jgi:protein phosphatase